MDSRIGNVNMHTGPTAIRVEMMHDTAWLLASDDNDCKKKSPPEAGTFVPMQRLKMGNLLRFGFTRRLLGRKVVDVEVTGQAFGESG